MIVGEMCTDIQLKHFLQLGIIFANISMRMSCRLHEVRLESGHEQAVAFLLLNQSVLNRLDQPTKLLLKSNDSSNTTCSIRYENATAFCAATCVPIHSLRATMSAYNACEEGQCDSFKKKCFPVQDFSCEEPLWVVTVTPVLNHSLGGLQV